ncbi:hypothetical protein LINPERPRIM_LOCUS14129 [Linum perenne]
MNLRICSITSAKLRGLLTGLKIVWDKGFQRIQVQLDSRPAIHWGTKRVPH